jgi:hypothetical protein
VHLVRGDWDSELVFHECLHGAFHLQRVTLGALRCEGIPMALEEPICYSIGQLAQDVYKWVWALDPNEKWSKSE